MSIPSVLSHHDLSDIQIDFVASGVHDDEVLGILGSAEQSRHLLATLLLARTAQAHPLAAGSLDTVDMAWNLLKLAQRHAPDVVDELFSLPQVGLWSTRTLRRLWGEVEDKAPLWFHIGQLHSLAAAAAIRAGLDFHLTVPLWRGSLTLLTLGAAQFTTDEEWRTAEVVANAASASIIVDSQQIHIGSEATSSWHPARKINASARGLDLSLAIDDISPYREMSEPVYPKPLDDNQFVRCSTFIQDAWTILTAKEHEYRASELVAGLATLTLCPTTFRFCLPSASISNGFGHAIISIPCSTTRYEKAQFASALVHEFQHSKLNAVNHITSLVQSDTALECYAPWRDDPRPTLGFLHGVYAFSGVMEFWQVERNNLTGSDRDLAHFEFALLRIQVSTALEELRTRPSLTEAGRRFVAGIATRVPNWHLAQVPYKIEQAAKFVTADHRARWRVSHVHPDQQFVELAVQAWMRGNRAPKEVIKYTVTPSEYARRPNVKALLIRWLLADPDAFSVQIIKTIDGAHESDFMLVQGDAAAAREQYLGELFTGSNRPGAWSGLGLAFDAVDPGPASTYLRNHPEVVRAICDEMRTITGTMPHPEAIAAWLAE